MGDITAFMSGRNKELVEMAEKVLKKLKREVEEKGLKRSLLEGKKERARRSHLVSTWRRGFVSAMQQERRSCVDDEC